MNLSVCINEHSTHRQMFDWLKPTSEGSVSSTRMFGPVVSGPKAQMDLAASRSQSYLVWKNSPSFFLSNKAGRVRRRRARNSEEMLYLGDKGVNGSSGVCARVCVRSFTRAQLGPDGLADRKLISSKTLSGACSSYKRKMHVCFERFI